MNERDQKTPTRCSIYTRKSHEEGLEQEFNSLDAQRESAEAYIKSQQHEGWQLIETRYDDGGFSGGNMKRPALTQLLDDIKCNKIDIVLVYKVDRLSRSLSDFSRLIELFDEHDVSFVSVTQQFNTSNSMGRLTLNMLLSFAQFEREVTGERIRDKIEASKKKGMWMGGNPPMGYRVEERRLVVIADEAAFVKQCFESYLKTPSLLSLAREFDEQGFRTKCWVSQKGNEHGGIKLSPKYLYRMLTNLVYIGQITHKKKSYEGQHDAIVDQCLWEAVQTQINQKPTQSNSQTDTPYLLKGKFRHHEGYSMSPSTFKKKYKDGTIKRTRYYVSQKAIKQGYGSCNVKSINARQIENIVISVLVHLLIEERNDQRVALESKAESERAVIFSKLLKGVSISPSKISIEISKGTMLDARVDLARSHADSELCGARSNFPILIYRPQLSESHTSLLASIEVEIKKIDGTRYILDSSGSDLYQETYVEPNFQILAAFKDAYQWRAMLDEDRDGSAKLMAEVQNISYMILLRKLPLSTLAPDILKLVLTGGLPGRVSLKQLVDASWQLNWAAQRNQLGI